MQTDPIFDETKGTLWHSLSDCGSFEINSNEAYSGNSSVAISWQKSIECNWMGFGNTFNNWQPTNLKDEINKKALRFYVKTQSGECSSIPIVLALEDFYGGGSYLFIDAKKYLMGLTIDSTWKAIIVPFWHFPIGDEIENDDVDISAIKQMKFQLEGSGSFYLDAIEIIDFSLAEYQKMLAYGEELKPNGSMEQIIYQEGLLNEFAWGTGQKACQELTERSDLSNNNYIHWKFDASQCGWAKWGINWNDWYSINFRGVLSASLKFRIKMIQNTSFDIRIEDFTGNASVLKIDSALYTNQMDWQEVSIPLSKFNLSESNFKIDRIKQIVFLGYGQGEIELDDLKITNQ